jgi:hypothetical protein
MKAHFATLAVLILSIILAIGCTQSSKNIQTGQSVSHQVSADDEKQLYTAYNIWRMRPHNMKCINYKYGQNILPAGTEVRAVDTKWDSRVNRNMITFKTDVDDKIYNIYFTKNWHPGKTIEDYKKLMFTVKSFEELTEGMSDKEITAIKKGIVLDGMSKNAVLVTYGYPPEHRTGSLLSDRWIYWRNKFTTFAVCFDDNDRTTPCQ